MRIDLDEIIREAELDKETKLKTLLPADTVIAMAKVVQTALQLKPLQPSEFKLGQSMVEGWDEFCVAIEPFRK